MKILKRYKPYLKVKKYLRDEKQRYECDMYGEKFSTTKVIIEYLLWELRKSWNRFRGRARRFIRWEVMSFFIVLFKGRDFSKDAIRKHYRLYVFTAYKIAFTAPLRVHLDYAGIGKRLLGSKTVTETDIPTYDNDLK